MRRLLLMILCLLGVLVSAAWLAGYTRAIWPYWGDGIRDGDFSFLAYPRIEWYTVCDEQTGQMSEMKIDWFSIADGPTGIIYAHRFFPSWIVSLAAGALLITSLSGAVIMWPRRE